MIRLGRLCMCLGLPRGLSTHEQGPRPRPDEGPAGTFASLTVIWGGLYLCTVGWKGGTGFASLELDEGNKS